MSIGLAHPPNVNAQAGLADAGYFAEAVLEHPPGFETHGTDANPRLRRFWGPLAYPVIEDLRLAEDSPAAVPGGAILTDPVLRDLGGHPSLTERQEALDQAERGKQDAILRGGPPSATNVLDDNAVAILWAMGSWDEAARRIPLLRAELDDLTGGYLRLLEAEIAVAQGNPRARQLLASGSRGGPGMLVLDDAHAAVAQMWAVMPIASRYRRRQSIGRHFFRRVGILPRTPTRS